MTDYRRNFLAGGSFFFTVNLAERHLQLLTDHIDKLRSAFRETRRHHPFTIDAMGRGLRRTAIATHSKPMGFARAQPILRATG
jgi:hypothetical protein